MVKDIGRTTMEYIVQKWETGVDGSFCKSRVREFDPDLVEVCMEG